MTDARDEITETWAVVRDRPGTEYAHVFLTFRAFRDDEAAEWVAECVELDVVSAEDNPIDALDRALAATTLYLHTLELTGERRRVFAERGIELHPGLPAEETADSHRQRIDVRPNEYVIGHVVAHRGELASH